MVWFEYKSAWLMNVDNVVGWHRRVDESGGDVTLGRAPTKFEGQDHDGSNSGPLGDRSPGFSVVDAFFLLVTAGSKTGLTFVDGTIGVPFNVEVPSRPKDFHVLCGGNLFPAFEDVGKGVDFFTHMA